MPTKRILPVIASLAIATSALTIGTSVSASGEHADDGAITEATQQAPLIPDIDVSALTLDNVVFGTVDTPRDVRITMTDDFRFGPDPVVVAAGETVRLLIDNPTAAVHSFLLGDLETQIDHEMEMAGNDGGHADGEQSEEAGEGGLPGVLIIEAGESAEALVTFESSGQMLIGCHRPGHWAAGMVGVLVVLPTI